MDAEPHVNINSVFVGHCWCWCLVCLLWLCFCGGSTHPLHPGVYRVVWQVRFVRY